MSVALIVSDKVTLKERRLQLGRALIRQVDAEESLTRARRRDVIDLKAYRLLLTKLNKARDLAEAWRAVCHTEAVAP